MKVTIGLDNVIVLDGDDIAEIATFVKALRNGATVASPPSQQKPGVPVMVDETELTSFQYDLWNWLASNAGPDGVHIDKIAEAIGISNAAANSRLKGLSKLEMVHKVRRGYWRAGEDPNKGAELPHPSTLFPASEEPADAPE